MRLIDLIKDIPVKDIIGDTAQEVKGITKDSRKVEDNYVFFATSTSESFIKDALVRGASIIVSNKRHEYGFKCQIITDDMGVALGKMASRFYGDPSEKISITGITGTNGKTTISYLIESILHCAGAIPGVIGTISHRYKGNILKAENTTPGAEELQSLLSDMVASGVSHVIMEVSSHALSQKRVEGIKFNHAIFTNLTHDHLDYHKTIDDYKEAKKLLFHHYLKDSNKEDRYAILNMDDPFVDEFVPEPPIKALFYSHNKKTHAHIVDYHQDIHGLRLNIALGKGRIDITSSLIGRFNASNILAACLFGYAEGISEESIKKGIEALEIVPGRLERVKNNKGYAIFIDYAHTPDALAKVLEMLDSIKTRRLITVFGCGGNRDTAKRPLMGDIATRLSDFVVITSDNPRNEEPEKIIGDIVKGVRGNSYKIIENRKDAIFEAISMLDKDDCLLIAGKGHEDYQIIGNKTYHFSDREVVEEYLNVVS
ncbi:MAG TPA: UDP-N-acetylmuramoyl-L-alanyl-D-glutamate--2,6-diaminopimelate ligase [Syntrophorhabdaceae bacterium]|nr:UDP-N-acetylmuramoyl-L-alanyl-D-glutamate--2,6-diaminopimelate ligase [Syntrophorhabdaceae bacterium]